MIRLIFDQGLPCDAAVIMRSAGYDAVHVSEVGMSAAEDEDILSLALKEGRTVVTLDGDFHALLALSSAPSPSVIRFRVQVIRAERLVPVLSHAVSQFEDELAKGAVMTIDAHSTRVRRLPLG